MQKDFCDAERIYNILYLLYTEINCETNFN